MIAAQAVMGAQTAQRKWGIPSAISLAQFGLESGWGAHMPAWSNNPFGIKALIGQPSVTVPTHEFIGGRYVMIEAAFRKFDSLADAFDAHAELLATGTPYYKARECIASGITPASVNAFANALTGVYATDPLYGQKLIQLMTEDGLYHYDVIPVAPTVVSVSTSLPPAQPLATTHVDTSPTGPAAPHVAGPPPAGPMTTTAPDFSPTPVQLPSQATALVQSIGTHLGSLAGGALVSWGAIQPNQETQLATIAGGIAVWGASLLVSYIVQYLRHQQAEKAVTAALNTPVPKAA
jgi:Mannosyl-glycoprotein endo-beta-N-acetylglucosaminidase